MNDIPDVVTAKPPLETDVTERVASLGAGFLRRVSVKGMQESDATVVVRVVQGMVWISIIPPFTVEAIMEPDKVDQMIQTLQSARREVERMRRGTA